ncbi:TetR/AcrR family transcriptional regulator [Lysobacter silvisoli]|uniref:TetR/AcrR family transcriptional regulator n=1 Tax=Lysobacter silvisoli TaxID=2293254 RepID=A0A371K1H6_9GAMM|nr:TetR/AcrR family transcriptional regulator [Lysobacter silvisoli]RDZ27738.1 TetR/AcrR family transcriptional regulator [Lysobacter silvisoli]
MSAPTTADRILRAARSLFERDGADAVSIRRVAESVGLTPMALYRHFPNREALLQRISDDSFQEIAHHWSARKEGGDVIARLLAIQRIYLDYALAHPHLFDHAFSMRRGNARRYPEDFRARRSPTLNVAADVVEEAQRAGELREGDAWDIAMTLWAHSHGLIALYRAGRFSYDERAFRAFYEASLGRLLDGLRA